MSQSPIRRPDQPGPGDASLVPAAWVVMITPRPARGSSVVA
ncbi:MAG: hypothetical protein RBU45_16020 [Myxococcota bacterium]|nr:hypothetical protein [Myxococcota bacterium]